MQTLLKSVTSQVQGAPLGRAAAEAAVRSAREVILENILEFWIGRFTKKSESGLVIEIEISKVW